MQRRHGGAGQGRERLAEPETPAENEALGLFLAELRQATGAEIAFRFATKPH